VPPETLVVQVIGVPTPCGDGRFGVKLVTCSAGEAVTVNTDEARAASYPAAAVEPTRRTHTPSVYCPAPVGVHGKLALGP
jgi:hypothetical protein